MIIDLIFAVATIIFIFAILPQIVKNFQVKRIKSQSILWHLITVCGLGGICIGHILCGYWISVLATVVQITERMVLIWQIIFYAVE